MARKRKSQQLSISITPHLSLSNTANTGYSTSLTDSTSQSSQLISIQEHINDNDDINPVPNKRNKKQHSKQTLHQYERAVELNIDALTSEHQLRVTQWQQQYDTMKDAINTASLMHINNIPLNVRHMPVRELMLTHNGSTDILQHKSTLQYNAQFAEWISSTPAFSTRKRAKDRLATQMPVAYELATTRSLNITNGPIQIYQTPSQHRKFNTINTNHNDIVQLDNGQTIDLRDITNVNVSTLKPQHKATLMKGIGAMQERMAKMMNQLQQK